MNKEVNFEIAKLLKEKGFNEPSDYYYDEDGDLFLHVTFTEKEDDWTIKAPTIAEVVMWLYEKHGIWTGVSDAGGFGYTIQFMKIDGDSTIESLYEYDSPTEAYEAAIKYVLTENLIQGGNK